MSDAKAIAEELLRFAGEAAQGEWRILYAGQGDMTEAECIAEDMPVVSIGPVDYVEFGHDFEGKKQEYADSRYIAAANPEAITKVCEALLQSVERERHIAKIVGDPGNYESTDWSSALDEIANILGIERRQR